MSSQVAKLIDTSLCQGCRSCQVACKQWNQLPTYSREDLNKHLYQNPKDLNEFTWLIVRFYEISNQKELKWIFFPDTCRHCPQPYCKMYCPVKDPPAIEKDKETGAVVIYPERCGNCCLECMKCPWQIPRFKTKGEKIYRQAFKCRLCLDRLKKKDRKSGQNLTVDAIPACAKACPQGAIWFGSKEQINQLTDTRLEITSKRFPKASIYPAKDYGVIWILTEPLKVYGLE